MLPELRLQARVHRRDPPLPRIFTGPSQIDGLRRGGGEGDWAGLPPAAREADVQRLRGGVDAVLQLRSVGNRQQGGMGS